MEKYKKLLQEYVSKKSVSTDPAYAGSIAEQVEWLQALLTENGFEVLVVEGYNNPIVVASYIIDPKLETCLIYGHYDVQPASKEDGWDTDPFRLAEKDGRLYARGIVDNKGQNLVHLVTVCDLIKSKKLKYNVKFMIEGNEETGSSLLGDMIRDNKELLKSDFVMISDGELESGNPALDVAFRGGFNLTLTVKTSDVELHSGLYGGTAPNALHELSKVIAGIYSPDNKIAIENYYEDVDEITSDERTQAAERHFDLDNYKKVTGTKMLLTEKGNNYYVQVGLLPSIEVTGIKSGYMLDGYRNSIPCEASAKINFRIVLSQKPDKVYKRFVEYVQSVLPSYATFEAVYADPYTGVKLKLDNKFIKRAVAKIVTAYGKEPQMNYCGASIPIVTIFAEELGIPNVLVPMGNGDCRMHATNENFELKHLEKALKFSELFFQKD